jgi:hypothetical protein
VENEKIARRRSRSRHRALHFFTLTTVLRVNDARAVFWGLATRLDLNGVLSASFVLLKEDGQSYAHNEIFYKSRYFYPRKIILY